MTEVRKASTQVCVDADAHVDTLSCVTLLCSADQQLDGSDCKESPRRCDNSGIWKNL